MRVTPIASPLPGEHLAATSPVMRPETEDAGWRLRLDFWAGRALTRDALEIEQENRAARLAWRGRMATAGIVRGLEVALEAPEGPSAELDAAAHFVHVLPGHGFLADGEDVVVPRPLRVRLDEIPQHYVRVFRPGQEAPRELPLANTIPGRDRDAGGFVITIDRFEDAHRPWTAADQPWAAVLVLSPVEFGVFERVDPLSPCDLDPSQDAFADERRIDACTLRLCEIPVAWRARPGAVAPADLRWRNYLAHTVFAEEALLAARQHVRFIDEEARGWETVLRAADLLPWEVLGVPLALVGAERVPGEETVRRFFLDRAAVARPGGAARPRTRPALRLAVTDGEAELAAAAAGSPFNWRARVDQFAEHLAAFDTRTAEAVASAASAFRFIPPAGLLPRAALTILTTEDAMRLPRPPSGPRDRAGINHLLPADFVVEAVPVAVEDMDAVLAGSAPLSAYDFESGNQDPVRLLVPVPQRLFDPRLLVVEEEDPVFAATLSRFLFTRQDWRQRRDYVRSHREMLRQLISGPLPEVPAPPLEPGQLEPEPVESSAGLEEALVSPGTDPGPWEISTDFPEPHAVTPETVLFLHLRIDEDFAPTRIDVRWRRGTQEFPFRFTERPPAPAERFQNGEPQAARLFETYTVVASRAGITAGDLDGFTVHLEDGRIALAWAGEQVQIAGGQPSLDIWWQPEGLQAQPRFVGGAWTRNFDHLWLLAPFEERSMPPEFEEPVAGVLRSLNAALNPPSATARASALSVASHGMERVLAELEAEAGEADDFVDANFTRTQTNLYRIRKLILGQAAAQKLLVNPAIATIAEQETAAASAEQLGAYIRAAKARPPISAALINDALSEPSVEGPRPPLNLRVDVAAATAARAADTTIRIEASTIRRDSLRDVRRQLPQTGPTLPPRGLSIGQRFTEPPATQNLAYARAALAELVDELPRLRLPLVGETVRSLRRQQVSLLDLQGRSRALATTVTASPSTTGGTLATGTYSYRVTAIDALGDETPPSPALAVAVTGPTGSVFLNWFTIENAVAYRVYRSIGSTEVFFTTASGPFTDTNVGATSGTPPPQPLSREEARTRLLDASTTNEADEAEVTLAALDITEVKSAILRTIERVIEQRRALILRGAETVRGIRVQHAAAANRVVAVDGKLAEARHDVSVARALRQEEQQRVIATNDRRDAVIRDEVRFLAYVRPRSVDLANRTVPYWKLELFGVPAPVPACLQRHDEPPAPLNAYIQLFRHAPARWFAELEPLLARLDTSDKLVALLEAARASAASFLTADARRDVRAASNAVQVTVLGAHQVIGVLRQRSAAIQLAERRIDRWKDVQREAREHAAVGDLIAGRHGSSPISAAAAGELDLIARVATCLHAEFGAVPPAIRLGWIERFSQFDRPAILRDLTVLPQYGRLERSTRRRLQEFADWLFKRVDAAERDAVILINDLVRLCLLLASHAPVNRIIAGHVPRPTPVRPGLPIPIRPLNPELVRVGMEVHVWSASRIVARGRVEDLQQGEVSARMETVDRETTTLDSSMRVQFVPAALSFLK